MEILDGNEGGTVEESKLSETFKKMIACFKSHKLLWRAVIGGQVMAVLICATGVCSELMADRYKIDLPAAQSLFAFLSILLCSLTAVLVRHCWSRSGRIDGVCWRLAATTWLRSYSWKYFMMAVVEVEANYMAVKAYQYTSIVSVQILDCLTLPVAFFLSMLLLKRNYRLIHYISLLMTMSGAVLVITGDAILHRNDTSGRSDPVKGDLLAAGAAISYGVLNVMQEKLVRQRPSLEYLTSVSLFACGISTIQTLSTERSGLMAFDFSNATLGSYMLGFVVAMTVFYFLLPAQLRAVGCVAVNMNLQTADVYSLLFGLLLFNNKFSPFYLVGWVIILVGSVVYSSRPCKDP